MLYKLYRTTIIFLSYYVLLQIIEKVYTILTIHYIRIQTFHIRPPGPKVDIINQTADKVYKQVDK